MMDTDEDRPLAGAPRVPSPSSYHLLECKLTDEAVGKERSLCIVFLSHHYEALVPNQLGKVLALTCEAAIHFSHIVHPC